MDGVDNVQIAIYEPACLIVGTRGRSLGGVKGLLPGSVSKYCLQNSPVPVIVVRPSSKREKKKKKRRADPTRRAYMDILERSGAKGSQVLDKIETDSVLGDASENEALAVAKAIGMPSSFEDYKALRRSSDGDIGDGGSLTQVNSAKSDYTSGPESPSPTGGLSPDEALAEEMRSPESDTLDSPDGSDDEGDVEGQKSNTLSAGS